MNSTRYEPSNAVGPRKIVVNVFGEPLALTNVPERRTDKGLEQLAELAIEGFGADGRRAMQKALAHNALDGLPLEIAECAAIAAIDANNAAAAPKLAGTEDRARDALERQDALGEGRFDEAVQRNTARDDTAWPVDAGPPERWEHTRRTLSALRSDPPMFGTGPLGRGGIEALRNAIATPAAIERACAQCADTWIERTHDECTKAALAVEYGDASGLRDAGARSRASAILDATTAKGSEAMRERALCALRLGADWTALFGRSRLKLGVRSPLNPLFEDDHHGWPNKTRTEHTDMIERLGALARAERIEVIPEGTIMVIGDDAEHRALPWTAGEDRGARLRSVDAVRAEPGPQWDTREAHWLRGRWGGPETLLRIARASHDSLRFAWPRGQLAALRTWLLKSVGEHERAHAEQGVRLSEAGASVVLSDDTGPIAQARARCLVHAGAEHERGARTHRAQPRATGAERG